jgi:hypothetical protein
MDTASWEAMIKFMSPRNECPSIKEAGVKIGEWYLLANNYEALKEMEPFTVEELSLVADSFKKLIDKLVQNKIKFDTRDDKVITDFIMKGKQRLLCSQQDVQEEYERGNQVDPNNITPKPAGGFSDKTDAQSNLNNNGGSNVSTT